jgi:hypothetical protein
MPAEDYKFCGSIILSLETKYIFDPLKKIISLLYLLPFYLSRMLHQGILFRETWSVADKKACVCGTLSWFKIHQSKSSSASLRSLNF